MGAYVTGTKEVLRAARALLAKPGMWAKGDENADLPDGCFCTATAVWLYSPSMHGRAKNNRLVLNHFQDVNGIKGFVSLWNDAPERTLEQVLAAFDKAIEAAS